MAKPEAVEPGAELRLAAGKTPPGNWLRAFGCDDALIRDGRGPSREELDQADCALGRAAERARVVEDRRDVATAVEEPAI